MIDFIQQFLFGVHDPNVHYAWIGMAMTAIGGIAQAAAGFDWGGKRRDALNKARKAYDTQKDIYKGLDTSNQFEGMTNQYSGLENTYEDLTVNQQQAIFEKQMFQQQQAGMMQGLQGAAGGSGIAGLAQAMANQGMTQAQKSAASIGQQEAKNRLLLAQQAGRLQELEAGEGSKLQQLERQGRLQSLQMEQGKQATLLGMEAQAVTGAQQAQMQGQQMMAEGFGNLAAGGIAKLGNTEFSVTKNKTSDGKEKKKKDK